MRYSTLDAHLAPPLLGACHYRPWAKHILSQTRKLFAIRQQKRSEGLGPRLQQEYCRLIPARAGRILPAGAAELPPASLPITCTSSLVATVISR
jgi:hypothetical protein